MLRVDRVVRVLIITNVHIVDRPIGLVHIPIVAPPMSIPTTEAFLATLILVLLVLDPTDRLLPTPTTIAGRAMRSG